ncbi:MAG: OadG family protein [Lachnospiraceae bacterium]|nr:OadG family protein [Lachnospiraceae bacterium]
MQIALEIMGMGMLGIFTAMIVIMLVTTVLKKIDNKKPEAK